MVTTLLRLALVSACAAGVHGFRLASSPLRSQLGQRPSFRRCPAPLLSEPPMWDVPQSEADRQAVNAKMESDLAAFRAQAAAEGVSAPTEVSILQKMINTLGRILTVNFFVIIGFFLWFLAGARVSSREFARRRGRWRDMFGDSATYLSRLHPQASSASSRCSRRA